MTKKPNFLLLMTDQQRFDTLGCTGNEIINTPNIDNLAKNGVNFINAYTQAPACVPARQNLMTGRHAHDFPLMTNNGTFPDREVPTLPSLLRNQGYHTQAIGKMHFKPSRNHMGFDRMELSEENPDFRQDDEYLLFLKDQGYGDVEEPFGKRHKYHYDPQVAPVPEEYHVTTWAADRTIEFLKNNRNRPFFCFTGFHKPHPAWAPPKPYHEIYDPDKLPLPDRSKSDREPLDDLLISENISKRMRDPSDKKIRRVKSRYYGMITHIDEKIGQIVGTLERYCLRKNTVLIFTSDHGELLGDHYAWGKRCFYEGASHVPFIASWPGMWPENEERDQLISLYDILPTILTLAGENIPNKLAGADLAPVIKDNTSSWRDQLYGEWGRGRKAKYMVRWDDWKYVFLVNGGREQLFNLREDPEELRNLASKKPDVCDTCKGKLARFFLKEGYNDALDGNNLLELEYEQLEFREPDTAYPDWPDNIPGESRCENGRK